MLPHFSVRRLNLPARLLLGLSRLFGALPSSRRRAIEAERQIIEASFLFDRSWYLQKYSDVARAGIDPVHHYLTVGWHEGRDPGPAFTTSAYLKANEDVAKAGVNPLLHFVQFGLAEGREGFGDRHLPPSVNWEAADFADPHECLSFPRPRPQPLVWRRGYRLDRGDPRYAGVGKAGAGYADDSSTRAAFETAVEWIRCLSGDREGALPSQSPPVNESAHRLLDAWYVNSAQLRTRWDCDQLPLVVRAFQCSPWDDDEIRLVGEGAIASPIDFIDVHLINPYFPILFAHAAADGTLLGTALLTFPSLCRGGAHYPELLWAAVGTTRSSLDVAAASTELTSGLVMLLRQEAEAAVGQIQVQTADADGNGPLFRKDLRVWLAKILQIDVAGDRPSAPPLEEPHTGGTSAAGIRRVGGGTLIVPPDASPTIAALIAHRAVGDGQRTSCPAPLLTSRVDPSKAVLLIDVPGISGPAIDRVHNLLPWLTPDASGLVPTGFPAAAIRVSSMQDLSDAQLLVPISGASLHRQQSRPAITWLVRPDEWDDDQLSEALQCLALQRGAQRDVLALIGPSAAGALGQGRKHFIGEVSIVKDRAKALRQVKTPLIGFVAGGILLHDPRTADCFSSMLRNDLISTASCVIVSAEKIAGVVKTVIVDGGALVRADGRPAAPAESAGAAAELWQGSWPVLTPSAYLWAARSQDLLSRSEAAARGDEGAAIHMCSSEVTATRLISNDATLRRPDVATATDTSTQVELLVG